MKALILNGSPKKKNSRTFSLTNHFLEGLKDNESLQPLEQTYIDIVDFDIHECIGCFRCWTQEGKSRCIYRDDMDRLIPLYEAADLVIWSFPLYFFLPPSNLVKFQQRMLPLMSPTIVKKDEDYYMHHFRERTLDARYELFFVSAGLPSNEHNFEAVDWYAKLLKRERHQKLFFPQSGCFDKEHMKKKIIRLRRILYEAGRSFDIDGGIKDKWLKKINGQLMIPDQYLELANRHISTKE